MVYHLVYLLVITNKLRLSSFFPYLCLMQISASNLIFHLQSHTKSMKCISLQTWFHKSVLFVVNN